MKPMAWISAILIVWNLAAFCAMGWDKRQAQRQGQRIAERRLLLWALCFGGLGIAAVNAILKKEGATESLWVAIPVAAMAVSASVSGGAVEMAAVTKSVCSALIAVVLLVSVRSKMIFSTPGKHFAGLPVDMISLGFLTMMLSVIA